MDKENKKFLTTVFLLSVLASSISGAVMGYWAGAGGLAAVQSDCLLVDPEEALSLSEKRVVVNEESAVIEAAEKVSPAVVSIIVSKDLPIIERYFDHFGGDDFYQRFFGDMGDFFGFGAPHYRENGTQRQEVGGGTGFIVSSDGHIITNRHVVADDKADYTVLLNDDSRHEARVLARDTFNDLAILKIEGDDFIFAALGDSNNVKVGQSVIAIGNSLGKFSNTVSTGVISGLSRSIVAGSYGQPAEQLFGVIQTDASINPGNSGGPLLNLSGEVIGINTAIAQGAQNIGFAIPVNEVKNIYESVRQHGRIIRPWLGVRYVHLNQALAEEYGLDIDYGALIVRGESRTDLAVMPGSPADRADLRENDVILELDGQRIDGDNPLARIISRYQPGDEIVLKIWSRGSQKEAKVKLEEMK